MFSPNTTNVSIKCQEKHDLFLTKNQSTTKIWIIGIVMCFALCVTIISIAICVGGLVKNKNNTLESSEMNNENIYIQDKFVKENRVTKPMKRKEQNIVFKSEVFGNLNNTQNIESNIYKYDVSNNLESKSKIMRNENVIEVNETEETIEDLDSDDFNLKNVVLKVMGSLADVTVDGIKSKTINLYSINGDEASKSIEATLDSNETKRNTTVMDKENNTSRLNIDQSKDNIINGIRNQNRNINYADKILSAHAAIEDMSRDMHNTQISSPDDVMGTVTTNLDLLKQYIPKDDKYLKSDLQNGMEFLDTDTNKTDFDEIIKFKDLPAHLSDFLDRYDFEVNDKGDTFYDHDYFYSESDAQSYYYDYERHTWTNYLLDKIQEVYNWITTDFEADEKGILSKANESATIPQLLQALNYTLLKGDLSILILKMKDLYDFEKNIEFNPERSKRIITNTSSVVSFGLLAIDIILLRNLQLMAWDDQRSSKYNMLNDPEVFALNSIFMDPTKVKEMYQNIKSKTSNVAENNDERASRLIKTISDEHDETIDDESIFSNTFGGFDFASFISSTIRAGIHLGRAFENTRITLQQLKSNFNVPSHGIFKMLSNVQNFNDKDGIKSTEIDCLWILYCKNLDKATKFDGPYGFLAKLNSVGLRLVLGELPFKKVIETLIEEVMTESRQIDCGKLFPRCKDNNAAKIVLQNVLENASPNYNSHKQSNVP